MRQIRREKLDGDRLRKKLPFFKIAYKFELEHDYVNVTIKCKCKM